MSMSPDFEMSMIAVDGVSESEDVTPLIEPLACSLRSSCLSTHCSACFRLIESNMTPSRNSYLTYCSTQCYNADHPIFINSGELELFEVLEAKPHLWPSEDHILYRDNSFLRLAIRFVYLIQHLYPIPPPRFKLPRILGLSCNNPDEFYNIQEGAILMSMARASRDGTDFPGVQHVHFEMLALTLVICNALRVSLGNDIATVGLALYDWRVSWINHSCCPNSYVRFVDAFQPQSSRTNPMAIQSKLSEDDHRSLDLLNGVTAPLTVSQLPQANRVNYGPRAAVQTICALNKGEEVTITYIDISLPELIRYNKLSRDYNIECDCRRCSGLDENDRFASVPREQVLHAPMPLDYQFLCRCRRCLGLQGEWKVDDPAKCLTDDVVSYMLQNLVLDDEDEPVVAPELGKNTKNSI